jgi:HK97 gp10 family phage protein
MFQMRGLSEVQTALRKLPEAMQEHALTRAAIAGALVIQEEAQVLAPVDTGTLRNSIVVSRTYKHNKRSHRIRGAVVVGIRGAARFYGHLIEFGWSKRGPQSFMRAALNNKAEEALRAMGHQLGREIERAARRVGKWRYTRRLLRAMGRSML